MCKKSVNKVEISFNKLSLRELKGVCVVGKNCDGFFFTSVKYSVCAFSNLYPFCEVEQF